MHSLLLDVWQWRDQPMRFLGRLPGSIKFIVPAAMAASVLYIVILTVGPRPVTISGKVISANTKAPLSNVLVAVESGSPHEEIGLGSYVKTDGEGNFLARAKGKVLIAAWKPGYALRSFSAGDAPAAKEQEIVLELRELTQTNWVPEHDAFNNLKPSHGFSFSLGEAVSANNLDSADIVVAQNEDDPSAAIIEAQGAGGIVFQPFDDRIDFYNTPEAPLTDYAKQLYMNREKSGLYFIRTRDGKHFGKFRLLVDLVYPPHGSPSLDLASARLLWAYQPDGTRNLEINTGKNFPFPLEKFGIKRE